MKNNLSILIYSLASGGAEKVVSILLNELNSRYNITLVLMNDTIFYDIPSSITVIYLKNSDPKESGIIKLLKLPILAYEYKQICKDLDINISLSFMNRPNYINILSRLMGNNLKILVSERIAPSQEYGENRLKDKISIFLIKYLYPKADLIIPNSIGIKLDLISKFSINKNKIRVIYNPIDIEKINYLKNNIIKNNMLRFTFITIGRLEKQKNHQLMIEAFSKIDDSNTQLIIIGEGKLRDELEDQITKLNLNNRIILLGRELNPYKYLNKADCFILSSNYEGFPNVLLEALSCNLPIISTDCISGPREILAPKSNISERILSKNEFTEYGVLVPLSNQKLLSQAMNIMKQKTKSSYHNNEQYVKIYSKENIVKQFINEL